MGDLGPRKNLGALGAAVRRLDEPALALALVTTLAIFSGVSSLSSPSHAGALLVQAQNSTSQG